MRNMITGITVFVVAGMVVWYLQRRTPDITYYVSSPIPIAGQGDQVVFAYQIKVNNTGSALASRITVRFPRTGADHQIQKWRESDEVKVTSSRDDTEVEYPELPPGGEFTINVKSACSVSGSPEQVKVFYQDGPARLAFSRDATRLGIAALYCALMGSIVLVRQLHWRRQAVELCRLPYHYQSAEKELSKGRRWYMSKGQWGSIKQSLIEHMTRTVGDDCRYCQLVDLEKSTAYRILDSETPELIMGNEWADLSEAAEKALEHRFGAVAASMYSQDRKLALLGTRRPERVRAEKWAEWTEEVEKNWVATEIAWTVARPNLKELAMVLTSSKPANLSQDNWIRYLDSVRAHYKSLLFREIHCQQRRPLLFLHDQQLGVLEDRGEELVSQAYAIELDQLSEHIGRRGAEAFLQNPRPDWLKEDDYTRLCERAESIVALPKRVRRYEACLHAVQAIAESLPLAASRPDALTHDDWESLSALAQRISGKRAELVALQDKLTRDSASISAERQKLSQDSGEVSAAREKLSRQLRIVHEVLSDPSAVDRIEDFENPFAPGNFENLRRVARHLADLANQRVPTSPEGPGAGT